MRSRVIPIIANFLNELENAGLKPQEYIAQMKNENDLSYILQAITNEEWGTIKCQLQGGYMAKEMKEKLNGKVVWVDGEWALIRDIDSFQTYLCNEREFKDKELNKGDDVKYGLYSNLYMSQVDEIDKI